MIALPDDPTFNQKDNHYDISWYKRSCAEFGVDLSADFLFKCGKNNGLGNMYIWIAYEGPNCTDYNYPDPDLALFDDECVTDRKDPNYHTNGIYFVRNDQGADKQFEHFVPDFAQGLTQAGLSRLNQSIEAFVYCVLGAQVNVRSSLLGDGGRAKEAQSEFLVLVEDAIRTPDISKSVQRYQLHYSQWTAGVVRLTHQTLFTNRTKKKVRKRVLHWLLRRQKRPSLSKL